jgi:hypothetical protein
LFKQKLKAESSSDDDDKGQKKELNQKPGGDVEFSARTRYNDDSLNEKMYV